MADDATGHVLPVDPSSDVGSERLAAALAARDVPAIGQALRHDYVVVPIVRGPGGETQVAVYGSGESPGSYELCVFSSAATFAAFVADSPNREFALRTGTSLAPVLTEHRALLGRVVFDPAGPHPVQASVEDVLARLEPEITDDDVAWVAGTGPAPDEGPVADRAVGLDLALPDDWFVLDVTDPGTVEKQAARLVRRQLRGVPASPALRNELTRWLTTAGTTASADGGRFLAFLLRRNADAALALTVTMFWHELGPEIGGRSHFDALSERLRSTRGADDELVTAETAAGPFVRHTRITQGAKEVGGGDISLLVTDYWLPFPDRRGLCHLSFTSPHVDLREPIQLLCDNVVLAGAWVMEPAAP
ncbi:hypothetical protein [Georgenia wangjunii]|uniref:hypothetical protein n=1 Tax=Georgenia wangjunii TaxID=3117730 RepID=UPI002F264085